MSRAPESRQESRHGVAILPAAGSPEECSAYGNCRAPARVSAGGMKAAGLTALFIALTAPLSADAPSPGTPAPVRRELSRDFRFEPKPESKLAPGSPAAAEQKVEKLAPVVVTAPGRPRQLESDLRQQAQALRERRFTPLNGGGTILGHKGGKITSDLQLKLIPVRHGAGVQVLSLSW